MPTVHLMRSTADTLSLSWLPPEKPNGVILDYEIKYHERVRSDFSPIILMSLTDGLTLKILLAAPRWQRKDFTLLWYRSGSFRKLLLQKAGASDVEQMLCGDSGVAGVSVGR